VKLTFNTSLLICLAAIVLPAVEPSAVLFENDQVKVARALERPHVKGGFHEHKPNRVMVYLQSGQQRFEYQDARKPAVFDWKAGDVKWSPAEGMHSPEVTSDSPFNIIEVEVKKAGVEKTIGGKLDSKHVKLEFENPQVRVLRVKLAAHEMTPMVQQSLNAVVILLTDEAARITTGDGKVTTVQHKAGDAVWTTPGASSLENTGDQPLEIVLVELKN
jgi:oxalate decarboxylase/phosphoglucose isomerase-like protein (cupin superfamily)